MKNSVFNRNLAAILLALAILVAARYVYAASLLNAGGVAASCVVMGMVINGCINSFINNNKELQK